MQTEKIKEIITSLINATEQRKLDWTQFTKDAFTVFTKAQNKNVMSTQLLNISTRYYFTITNYTTHQEIVSVNSDENQEFRDLLNTLYNAIKDSLTGKDIGELQDFIDSIPK